MKDMHAHLEKLRIQVVECELIRDLATNPRKRELFARLATHFDALAKEIEKAMADSTSDTFLVRETQELFSKEEE